MDISKIKFIESAGNHRQNSDMDVTVSLLKDDSINITLRNNSIDRLLNIWNDGKLVRYMLIAVVGDRMYLKGTNAKNGFAVNKNPQTENRYCRIAPSYHTEELKEWILNNEGSYKLKYDAEARLHYIEPEIKFVTKEG